MTLRCHHFFVLYRPDQDRAQPWPVSQYQQHLAKVRLLPPGDWHFVAAGPLLLGWLGDAPAGPASPLLLRAGDFSQTDTLELHSPDCAQRLAAGITTPFPLDGAYAAVAFDPLAPRAALITDRFGLLPIYSHEADGCWIFATSLRVLGTLAKPVCHLDHDAVLQMICLQMVLGNRTLLREVSLVPPAQVLALDGSRPPQPSAYWRWNSLQPRANGNGVANLDLVRTTYELIERAVLRSIPPSAKKVALPLSGGLDSRMLAAVLHKNQIPFHAYNVDFGRETAIARQVAAALQAPLRVLPMLAQPAATLHAGHDLLDGCYHVNQTWGLEMVRQAAADGCDFHLDGLAFDTILGSVHHVGNAQDPPQLARALQNNYQEVRAHMLTLTADDQLAHNVDQSLLAALTDAAHEAIAEAGPLASDYFLMNNRIRRYTFGYCLANLHYLPGGFPYVSRDLFDHCLALPLQERLEHRLYRRIYTTLFPDLARIPWAKTGLPLDQYGPPPDQQPWRQWLEAVLRRVSLGRINCLARDSFDRRFRTQRSFRDVFCQGLQRHSERLRGCLPETIGAKAIRFELAGRNVGNLIHGLFSVQQFLGCMSAGGVDMPPGD